MRRISLAALLVSLAALLLLIPATAAPSSGAKLRGTVAAKFPDNGLIRVDSRRTASILRVPGSQARIQTGQRVELRGATLRQRGHGSRVLARNVTVVRSVALRPTSGGSLAPTDDDELEVKGTLTSLSPLTVTIGSKTAICAVPSGMSLAGFAVGDFVEMTCDLRGGVWTLRKLEHEDDDDGARGDDDDDENDDHSGPGHGDDDDDDHSGHGNGDDDDDDDNSGHGGGDDDADDDHSED
jgi:hypothetical protein